MVRVNAKERKRQICDLSGTNLEDVVPKNSYIMCILLYEKKIQFVIKLCEIITALFNVIEEDGMSVGKERVSKRINSEATELVDIQRFQRSKVEILCVQETRWKYRKTRSLGGGYREMEQEPF